MATFFGRPVNDLLRNVGIAAGIGGAMGAVEGYWDAHRKGSDHPFREAAQTAGEWALTDIVVEGSLGLFAPNLRSGGPLRSTLTSATIGGASGFAEGYLAARAHHEEDPIHQGLKTGAQWAALEGGAELAVMGISPLIRKFRNRGNA